MNQTIYHSKMNKELKFQNLCNLTTSVLGLHKGSLAEKSRRQELQVPRAVASVIALTEDEVSHTQIGKVIKRDRSLIYHYAKMHQSNYATFPRYRETFNKIYNAYSNFKEDENTFFDLAQLKDYLDEYDIVDSVKHQTTVKITSGRIVAEVKLSYKDFYNQLEMIKLALENFQYETEIITL